MAAGMTSSMPFQSVWVYDPESSCTAANYDHNGYFAAMYNLDSPGQAKYHPDGCNSRFRAMCMTGNYVTTTPPPYEPPSSTYNWW